MLQRLFYILIFNCIIAFSASGQDVSVIRKLAENHYENGNFIEAAKEYNRAIFFDSEVCDHCLMRIAECYFYLEEYNLSQSFFDKAFFAATSDSLRTEAILGKAYSYVLQNQFLLAKRELFNIEQLNDNQNRRYMLLMGTSFYGLADYKNAELAFNNLVASYKPEELEHVKMLFRKLEKSIKWLSPKRAMWMSYVIPGSGQFFIGEVKEGVNAMVLVGGLVYLYLRFSTAF